MSLHACSDPPLRLLQRESRPRCDLDGVWSLVPRWLLLPFSPGILPAQSVAALLLLRSAGPAHGPSSRPQAPFPHAPAGLTSSLLSGIDEKGTFSPKIIFLSLVPRPRFPKSQSSPQDLLCLSHAFPLLLSSWSSSIRGIFLRHLLLLPPGWKCCEQTLRRFYSLLQAEQAWHIPGAQ